MESCDEHSAEKRKSAPSYSLNGFEGLHALFDGPLHILAWKVEHTLIVYCDRGGVGGLGFAAQSGSPASLLGPTTRTILAVVAIVARFVGIAV